MRTALVTGAAGFIGFHLSRRLLEEGWQVVGIDNLNDYYDPALKESRLRELEKHPAAEHFQFERLDIADRAGIEHLFGQHTFDRVIHLAAQAGVRYSLENPHAYVDSNLVGFVNILEVCRHHRIEHLLYASSSSVYGLNEKVPFSEGDRTDAPISLYAATKKSNELMAFTYSHLFNIPMTGMRFFTVYGPWGRPDMAYWSFTEKILKGEEIPVFNHGNLKRDFTYIDDIIEGIWRLIDHIPQAKAGPSSKAKAPHDVYNLGNNQPVPLKDFIAAIEEAVGKKARIKYLPMQPGDVEVTFASINKMKNALGWAPSLDINKGVSYFVKWYVAELLEEKK
ncbi:UDP-glucuronate 4-epimerase [Sulfurivirga caldicuralii]|uniref:UDP-glucuronate 4-epimerase n=1 Tax=Sulfurivirga caldicuralii TaxID=364032 RepID=A0A1N6DZH3_9GAMM|nr:NAD-dependent epimerase [Sulfurivirga caldicuralii]SIN76151.1 UDP-glucuronate 4-epimerase [Sulfurivirga caldicuralii]